MGKGVLVMSAKGSDEEVGTMKAIAALTGRTHQLKVFSLPAWNVAGLFSHTYNIVHVRPRRPESPGGDVVATAQRVFSVLPLGDNVFYRTQAEVMFTNLCRLLHGLVDDDGHGIPFVLKDVSVCLKAVGNVGGWARALDHVLAASLDREAAALIRAQVKQLDRDVLKALSGLVGALDKFQSDLVNAYDPDIVFEDVLETNGLVYVQLPANLFRIQAPALGKVILMDVQQEGSLRQVFRTSRNQRPFSVTVDEFYNFADLSIVDSLNKLRDANLEYTLAHQSLADLELVSKEFATAVWDNTRSKDILNQDNPELCERIARSIGTRQIRELTVRRKEGPLLTSLATGDASSQARRGLPPPPQRDQGARALRSGLLTLRRGARAGGVRDVAGDAGGVRAGEEGPKGGAGVEAVRDVCGGVTWATRHCILSTRRRVGSRHALHRAQPEWAAACHCGAAWQGRALGHLQPRSV